MKNIGQLAKQQYDLSPIVWELEDPFHNGGNFSLVPMPDGNWLCCMRIFAYLIDGQGRYLQPPQMKLKNPHLHRFCVLDRDFNLVRKVPNIQSTFYQHPQYNEKFPYLEDARFACWNGRLYTTSTVVYQTTRGWAALGLELQEIDFLNGGIVATHQWNSVQQGIGGIQKNWLPVEGRPFHYIVGTSEHGAQWIDISTNEIVEAGIVDKNILYRGNTPLVKFDGGYLAITHKVDLTTKVKTYTNYLVKYGKDLSVQWISRPFKLTNSEIEFVTVMQIVDDEILIGVTENDDTPLLFRFHKAEFLGMVNIS